jgi:hypothetical protein
MHRRFLPENGENISRSTKKSNISHIQFQKIKFLTPTSSVDCLALALLSPDHAH